MPKGKSKRETSVTVHVRQAKDGMALRVKDQVLSDNGSNCAIYLAHSRPTAMDLKTRKLFKHFMKPGHACVQVSGPMLHSPPHFVTDDFLFDDTFDALYHLQTQKTQSIFYGDGSRPDMKDIDNKLFSVICTPGSCMVQASGSKYFLSGPTEPTYRSTHEHEGVVYHRHELTPKLATDLFYVIKNIQVSQGNLPSYSVRRRTKLFLSMRNNDAISHFAVISSDFKPNGQHSLLTLLRADITRRIIHDTPKQSSFESKNEYCVLVVDDVSRAKLSLVECKVSTTNFRFSSVMKGITVLASTATVRPEAKVSFIASDVKQFAEVASSRRGMTLIYPGRSDLTLREITGMISLNDGDTYPAPSGGIYKRSGSLIEAVVVDNASLVYPDDGPLVYATLMTMLQSRAEELGIKEGRYYPSQELKAQGRLSSFAVPYNVIFAKNGFIPPPNHKFAVVTALMNIKKRMAYMSPHSPLFTLIVIPDKEDHLYLMMRRVDNLPVLWNSFDDTSYIPRVNMEAKLKAVQTSKQRGSSAVQAVEMMRAIRFWLALYDKASHFQKRIVSEYLAKFRHSEGPNHFLTKKSYQYIPPLIQEATRFAELTRDNPADADTIETKDGILRFSSRGSKKNKKYEGIEPLSFSLPSVVVLDLPYTQTPSAKIYTLSSADSLVTSFTVMLVPGRNYLRSSLNYSFKEKQTFCHDFLLPPSSPTFASTEEKKFKPETEAVPSSLLLFFVLTESEIDEVQTIPGVSHKLSELILSYDNFCEGLEAPNSSFDDLIRLISDLTPGIIVGTKQEMEHAGLFAAGCYTFVCSHPLDFRPNPEGTESHYFEVKTANDIKNLSCILLADVPFAFNKANIFSRNFMFVETVQTSFQLQFDENLGYLPKMTPRHVVFDNNLNFDEFVIRNPDIVVAKCEEIPRDEKLQLLVPANTQVIQHSSSCGCDDESFVKVFPSRGESLTQVWFDYSSQYKQFYTKTGSSMTTASLRYLLHQSHNFLVSSPQLTTAPIGTYVAQNGEIVISSTYSEQDNVITKASAVNDQRPDTPYDPQGAVVIQSANPQLPFLSAPINKWVAAFMAEGPGRCTDIASPKALCWLGYVVQYLSVWRYKFEDSVIESKQGATIVRAGVSQWALTIAAGVSGAKQTVLKEIAGYAKGLPAFTQAEALLNRTPSPIDDKRNRNVNIVHNMDVLAYIMSGDETSDFLHVMRSFVNLSDGAVAMPHFGPKIGINVREEVKANSYDLFKHAKTHFGSSVIGSVKYAGATVSPVDFALSVMMPYVSEADGGLRLYQPFHDAPSYHAMLSLAAPICHAVDQHFAFDMGWRATTHRDTQEESFFNFHLGNKERRSSDGDSQDDMCKLITFDMSFIPKSVGSGVREDANFPSARAPVASEQCFTTKNNFQWRSMLVPKDDMTEGLREGQLAILVDYVHAFPDTWSPTLSNVKRMRKIRNVISYVCSALEEIGHGMPETDFDSVSKIMGRTDVMAASLNRYISRYMQARIDSQLAATMADTTTPTLPSDVMKLKPDVLKSLAKFAQALKSAGLTVRPKVSGDPVDAAFTSVANERFAAFQSLAVNTEGLEGTQLPYLSHKYSPWPNDKHEYDRRTSHGRKVLPNMSVTITKKLLLATLSTESVYPTPKLGLGDNMLDHVPVNAKFFGRFHTGIVSEFPVVFRYAIEGKGEANYMVIANTVDFKDDKMLEEMHNVAGHDRFLVQLPESLPAIIRKLETIVTINPPSRCPDCGQIDLLWYNQLHTLHHTPFSSHLLEHSGEGVARMVMGSRISAGSAAIRMFVLSLLNYLNVHTALTLKKALKSHARAILEQNISGRFLDYERLEFKGGNGDGIEKVQPVPETSKTHPAVVILAELGASAIGDAIVNYRAKLEGFGGRQYINTNSMLNYTLLHLPTDPIPIWAASDTAGFGLQFTTNLTQYTQASTTGAKQCFRAYGTRATPGTAVMNVTTFIDKYIPEKRVSPIEQQMVDMLADRLGAMEPSDLAAIITPVRGKYQVQIHASVYSTVKRLFKRECKALGVDLIKQKVNAITAAVSYEPEQMDCEDYNSYSYHEHSRWRAQKTLLHFFSLHLILGNMENDVYTPSYSLTGGLHCFSGIVVTSSCDFKAFDSSTRDLHGHSWASLAYMRRKYPNKTTHGYDKVDIRSMTTLTKVAISRSARAHGGTGGAHLYTAVTGLPSPDIVHRSNQLASGSLITSAMGTFLHIHWIWTVKTLVKRMLNSDTYVSGMKSWCNAYCVPISSILSRANAVRLIRLDAQREEYGIRLEHSDTCGFTMSDDGLEMDSFSGSLSKIIVTGSIPPRYFNIHDHVTDLMQLCEFLGLSASGAKTNPGDVSDSQFLILVNPGGAHVMRSKLSVTRESAQRGPTMPAKFLSADGLSPDHSSSAFIRDMLSSETIRNGNTAAGRSLHPSTEYGILGAYSVGGRGVMRTVGKPRKLDNALEIEAGRWDAPGANSISQPAFDVLMKGFIDGKIMIKPSQLNEVVMPLNAALVPSSFSNDSALTVVQQRYQTNLSPSCLRAVAAIAAAPSANGLPIEQSAVTLNDCPEGIRVPTEVVIGSTRCAVRKTGVYDIEMTEHHILLTLKRHSGSRPNIQRYTFRYRLATTAPGMAFFGSHSAKGKTPNTIQTTDGAYSISRASFETAYTAIATLNSRLRSISKKELAVLLGVNAEDAMTPKRTINIDDPYTMLNHSRLAYAIDIFGKTPLLGVSRLVLNQVVSAIEIMDRRPQIVRNIPLWEAFAVAS